MIKIVGQDNTVMKRVTCQNCGAILEYTKSDVKEYHGTDYSGGPDGREWIDCPKCLKEIILRSW